MPESMLIGIAGGTGSGKTSVARCIYDALGPERVIIIRQDSYYRDLSHLPEDERSAFNFDHPDSFDMPYLLRHIGELLKGGTVNLPVYDYVRHCRTSDVETVGGSKIVILEGILVLFDPVLRDLMRIKVYIDTDPDIRFIRRLKRDINERGRTVDSVISQYQTTVRPMHLQFVEPTKRYADVVVPEGAHNQVAVDLLITKIRSLFTTVTPH